MASELPANIERILNKEDASSADEIKVVKEVIRGDDRVAYALLTDSRLSRFLRLNNALIQELNAGGKL